MDDLGKNIRTIEVEPLELPEPIRQPEQEPQREPEKAPV